MIKLLLIDDRPDNLTSITALIKAILPNTEIFGSQNGPEGISIAQKEQPDVILLDIFMPEMNGFEVCKILKEKDSTRHIPIIMLTAHKSDKKNKEKGLELGADAFLYKPLDETELISQIKVMWRIKKAEDQLREEKKELEKIISKNTKKLRERERSLSTLMSNLPGMAYQCINDKNWTMLFLSNGCYKLTGYQTEELLNNNTLSYGELIVDEDKESLWNKVQEAISKRESFTVQYRIQKKDGSIRWVWEQGIGIYDQKGKLESLEGFISDITERKKTEDTLIENEERYRRLFEDSIDPILIIENFKFVDCNEATVKFLNYENKSQFLEKAPNELSPDFQPDGKSSKDKAIELMDLALKKGNLNFEWIHLTKDKKEVWVDVSLTHIPTQGKNCLYTIWRDITDRKNAETTQEVLFNISESSETAESLNVLSEIIHKELGKIIDNSNFYIALYNTKNNTYSFPFYKDEFEVINPEDEFNLSGSITEYVRKEGKAIRITKALEAKLNKIKKIKSIGKPSPVWIGAPLIDTSTDKIIGVVAAQNYENEDALTDKDVDLLAFVARNIGTSIARKKAELAITESEEQFRSLAQTATDAIIIIDNNGDIIYWNKAATTIFQHEPSEVLGKDLHSTITPPEYLKKASDEFKKFISTGKGDVFGKTLELTGIRKDGSHFPIELSVSKFLKNGQWHATSFIRDITQRKKDEEELKQAKNKAEESDRLKTAFLANMSHEIRTPMNAILGFSELLSMTEISEEEQTEFIKLIQNNSATLLNLINDIIDIAKIEAEQLHILTTEFSINKLLEDIEKTYSEIRNNLGKENIEIALRTPNLENDLIIISDQSRINQVVSNLVGNALKYSEKGKIEFGYIIFTKEDNRFIQFFVKDTGIGIPDNKKDVIFERFRQGDDSYTRVYGGTGLGLAISKNIAKLLNGDITVESKEGIGSTFYFTIPLKISKKKQALEEKKIAKNAKFDLSGKSILIAEDVDSNYQLLKTYLIKSKATIHWAKNGQEAIKECKSNNSINIVLMDMQMPVLNGYQATQEIKSFRPDLPIIAVTAFALAGDQEKILEAGCDYYIPKPIKADLLYKTIKKYIL